MAVVTFDDIWLHEVSDYSVNTAFPFYAVSLAASSGGGVVVMADGSFVAVNVPGTLREWAVSLRFATRADVEWLRGRVGDSFMVRTSHGELFFAKLGSVAPSEELLPGTPSTSKVGAVEFALTEVSLTEEV